MSRKKVLIFGSPLDGEVAAVSQELLHRDVEPVVLQTEQLWQSWHLIISQDEVRVWTITGHVMIYMEDVAAVWTRRVDWPASPNLEAMLWAMLRCPHFRFINPIDGVLAHRAKPWQLYMAPSDSELKVIPSISVTSNYRIAPRPWLKGENDILAKPAMGGASPVRLENPDFPSTQFDACTYQHIIKGTPERWVKIGKKWFRFIIRTEHLDYRNDPAPQITFQVPRQEFVDRLKLNELCEMNHLEFAGLDLIQDEKGDFYFIEINPSPMLTGFQSITGAPLVAELASFLCEDQDDGETEQA